MDDADRQGPRTLHEPLAVLGALLGGGGLVAVCLAFARLPNLVEAPGTFLVLFALGFAAYALGAGALQRVSAGRALLVLLVVSAACRLSLWPVSPTLSTDAYRYVWDARVAAAGFSPWTYPPVAPELAPLRDDAIYPLLNHATWRSVYPPGAQGFFRAIYALVPDSVGAMKTALGLAEILTVAALLRLLATLRLPLARAAIWAWNPLVLIEVWGSAHLDALAILCVVLAVGGVSTERHATAGALLGAGTLIKLYPAALLPVIAARLGGRAPVVRTLSGFLAVLLLGYAPPVVLGMEALGSLPRYLAEERFNPGLMGLLPLPAAVVMAAIALWVLGVAWCQRDRPLAGASVWLVGGFVLLGPNIFPWYVLWLVPFLALAPSAAWLAFTGTVALAYAFFISEPWALPSWARALEFAPLAAGGVWALSRRRPGRALKEPTPA